MKYFLLVGFLGMASASCSDFDDCLDKCFTAMANDADLDACQTLCDGTYVTVVTEACSQITDVLNIQCGNDNATACNVGCSKGTTSDCPEGCTDVATCSAICDRNNINACGVSCFGGNMTSCDILSPDQTSADQASACLDGDLTACDASCSGGNTASCQMKPCILGRANGDETECYFKCVDGLSAACPEGCDDVATCSALCDKDHVDACSVSCADNNATSCHMNDYGCFDATSCNNLCDKDHAAACDGACQGGYTASCNMRECLLGRANNNENYCSQHCAEGTSATCADGCTDLTTCSALCLTGNVNACYVGCFVGNYRQCMMIDCLNGNSEQCLLACLGGPSGNPLPQACSNCTDKDTCSTECSTGNNDACIAACHFGDADSCDAAVLKRMPWQVDLGEDAHTLNSLANCIRGDPSSCSESCGPNHYTNYEEILFLRGCSEEFQYCCKNTCVESVYHNRIDGTPTNTVSCKLACKAGDTRACLDCLDDPECASGCTHLADMYKGSCGCEE